MKKGILIKKLKILKNKAKHFMLACGLTGLSLGAPMMQSCQNGEVKKDKTEVKADSAINKVDIKHPVATIGYYTDTLYHATSTLMFYNKGKVTRYYVEKNNSFSIRLPYFVHEDWHRHNAKSGFKIKSKLSPYEYYKLCIQDEITANLAAILTARYEYLASQDKKAIIKKYENSYMDFYFTALKEGKIKPQTGTMDIEERSFLANGVKKMWLETYYNAYAPKICRMIPRYVSRLGFHPSNPKLYQKYVSYFWTVGGINFSNYLESDIDAKGDKTVMLADEMKDVQSFKKDYSFLVQNIMGNAPKLEEFAIDDQQQALLNLVISAKLKSALKTKDASFLKNNSGAVSSAYNKVVFELIRDSSFYHFFNRCSVINKNQFNLLVQTDNPEEKIRNFYVYKGIDLSRQIDNFTILKTIDPKDNSCDLFVKFCFKPELDNEQKDTLFATLTKEEPVAILSEKKAEVPAKETKRQRISDMQYIDIPNFWEPILTSAQPEDNEAILQMMTRFNEIPYVLKSCNTEKIEQYNHENDITQQMFAKSKHALR